MRGSSNTTGVTESTSFTICPEGEHLFEVSEVGEAQTKNFDPMAKLTLTPRGGKGTVAKVYDNIVIPKEGSVAWKIMGRTKRFLHCIGEPHEGQFDWDTARWVGKIVKANIEHEIQKEGKNAGKPRAIVANYVLDDVLALKDGPFND